MDHEALLALAYAQCLSAAAQIATAENLVSDLRTTAGIWTVPMIEKQADAWFERIRLKAHEAMTGWASEEDVIQPDSGNPNLFLVETQEAAPQS